MPTDALRSMSLMNGSGWDGPCLVCCWENLEHPVGTQHTVSAKPTLEATFSTYYCTHLQAYLTVGRLQTPVRAEGMDMKILIPGRKFFIHVACVGAITNHAVRTARGKR